jgi:predicted SAM-dependent methyltransferase
LRVFPNYVYSEYFPGVAPGVIHQGVRCEDLHRLSFSNESIDLIVTEDVIEHVRHPALVFKETHRVLVPGGFHVFTVPVYGNKTVSRVDTRGEQDIYLLPPVYHDDPLCSRGILAYNDFGVDIVDVVAKYGFRTRLVKFNTEDRRYLCGDVIVAEKKAPGS